MVSMPNSSFKIAYFSNFDRNLQLILSLDERCLLCFLKFLYTKLVEMNPIQFIIFIKAVGNQVITGFNVWQHGKLAVLEIHSTHKFINFEFL